MRFTRFLSRSDATSPPSDLFLARARRQAPDEICLRVVHQTSARDGFGDTCDSMPVGDGGCFAGVATQLESTATNRGSLVAVLTALDRLCDARLDVTDLDPALTQLRERAPTRAAAQAVVQTAAQVRWPTALYGPLPYGRTIEVLRAALTGVAPPAGSGPGSRTLHQALVAAYGLPSAAARFALSQESLAQRYPRLLLAMQQGALLTMTEAQASLYQLLHTQPAARARCAPASEAAAHFGGNLKVVSAGCRWRARFPSTRRVARG